MQICRKRIKCRYSGLFRTTHNSSLTPIICLNEKDRRSGKVADVVFWQSFGYSTLSG